METDSYALLSKVVTPDTTHFETSPLNCDALKNAVTIIQEQSNQ